MDAEKEMTEKNRGGRNSIVLSWIRKRREASTENGKRRLKSCVIIDNAKSNRHNDGAAGLKLSDNEEKKNQLNNDANGMNKITSKSSEFCGTIHSRIRDCIVLNAIFSFLYSRHLGKPEMILCMRVCVFVHYRVRHDENFEPCAKSTRATTDRKKTDNARSLDVFAIGCRFVTEVEQMQQDNWTIQCFRWMWKWLLLFRLTMWKHFT